VERSHHSNLDPKFTALGEVLVSDNQQVKAGQTLVKLDPRDLQLPWISQGATVVGGNRRAIGWRGVPRTQLNTQSEHRARNAQLAFAQADFKCGAQSTYRSGAQLDLAYATGQHRKKQSQRATGQADLGRYRPLMEKGEISKQQFDAAQANADATGQRVESDQEKLAQAQRGVELRKAQFDAANARVDSMPERASFPRRPTPSKWVMRQADAQEKLPRYSKRERARSSAAQSGVHDVLAPVDGVVTHKQVEIGQIVEQGQGI